jgi:hypothetical protein
MKNLQTLKLGASSIGAAAPRQGVTSPADAAPAADTPKPVAATAEPAVPVTVRKTAGGAKRLLALLGLAVVATLAAVMATGAIHNTFARLATVVVLLAAAAGVLAAVAAAHRRPRRPAVAAAGAPRKQFSMTKAMLLLMMAVGIAAYFGGAGTWAGFTAETANPNDTLASGTLSLRNNVTTNCDSQTGESNNNVNANCNVALTYSNQEPGVFTGTATVTLTNTGSLNASKLYLWAPFANGVFNGTTVNSGDTVNSLSLYASGHGPAGVEGTIAGGDLVVVTYGSKSQTFKVGAAGAAPGATSIPIVNNVTYPNVSTMTISAGATVVDQSSDTTAANTDCYDTQQTVYTFNPTTNNPLCSATLLYVQETTSGKNYCWFGSGHGSATGMCDAPISSNPTGLGTSANQTIAAGTYAVSALKGNVKSGDTVAFTESGNVVTCPASSSYYIGATSITVGACSVQSGSSNGVFDNNAVITDTTTLATLASDSSDTISQFDITKNYNLKQELTPVSSNGSTGVATSDLASGASRTFVVGVIIPGPAAPQNQLQGLKSTFGLTWHIDQ